MGHTNSTTHYGLPQFLTSDKPAWLTDFNNAMSDIDAGLYTAQSDANTAGTNASQALLDASAASTAASAADAKGAGACASIEAAFDATAVYAIGSKVMYNSLLYRCTVAVTTPGPWTGSANWERITVNSLIPGDAAALPLGTTTPAGSTAEAIANATAYDEGDTITATVSKYCAGRSTSDGSKVVFFYPLPKSVATNSSTLTITSNSNAWRHDGGPTALNPGTYSGSVTDGGLYFIVDLVTSITGNRLVNIELNNRTVTFVNTP